MESTPSPCCGIRRGIPKNETSTSAKKIAKNKIVVKPQSKDKMIYLPGGEFWMGTNDEEGFSSDGEGPERKVCIDPFYIAPFAVTNAEFRQFVEDTGYVTEAEDFGWSFVFHLLVSPNVAKSVTQVPAETPWWYAVNQADWSRPEGPDSTIDDRWDHPAVHISWNDAAAYCKWAGFRLPTEAEWEYAARGGLDRKRYPWGNELRPEKQHRCNIWQGKFPEKNHASDGYIGTAPVQSYEPNGYGIYNTSGNVWEWCADWFHPKYHEITGTSSPLQSRPGERRSMRGGSYLCHRSYCNRYRVAARSSNTPDSSSGNIGFRCAASVD